MIDYIDGPRVAEELAKISGFVRVRSYSASFSRFILVGESSLGTVLIVAAGSVFFTGPIQWQVGRFTVREDEAPRADKARTLLEDAAIGLSIRCNAVSLAIGPQAEVAELGW